MYKSLYIHIPFCKMICTYCDFKREINSDENIKKYIEKIILEINQIKHVLNTIYIGGGTPNILNDELLENFLNSLNKNINKDTEVTIELNPELITRSQLQILKSNNVNRISLGVQSTNNDILRNLGRLHTIEIVEEKIILLNEYNFKNISCDFIYNLPNMKISDVDNMISFIEKYDIKHLSFYSLEIKEGSMLNKLKYKIDYEKEEEFLFYFQNKIRMNRYEISNWSKDEEYESRHNKAYWNMEEWKGIGYGSCGFENNTYTETEGNTSDWKYIYNKISIKELYKDILIMGLRQVKGLNLNNKKNSQAFDFYKNSIPKNLIIIENNYIRVKEIDLLNEVLLSII
ncbi:MAG: radical SAM protein [Mycoplasmoidaceae bacterium]